MSEFRQDEVQRHWAKVNDDGIITNVIHCLDPELAKELGYELEITGTELGIGKPIPPDQLIAR